MSTIGTISASTLNDMFMTATEKSFTEGYVPKVAFGLLGELEFLALSVRFGLLCEVYHKKPWIRRKGDVETTVFYGKFRPPTGHSRLAHEEGEKLPRSTLWSLLLHRAGFEAE